ncbi:transketolase [Oscillospiraceae bacterium MB08-C2-2]|nr:transketolase [Oscillospiraceae bacterium MB08-C2-2]
MKNLSAEQLKEKAKELRINTINMIHEAQSGHPGGSLSAADLVAALYFGEMNVDPQNPKWEDRDRFILSKGHVCPIQYSALAMRGFFPWEVVHTLRQEGSILQGHPDMKKCPGIDISTGSLGQGLSCGVGMALAGKRDNRDYRVFALLGDGECQEGQVWEAAQTAVKYRLDNLVVFVDNNRLQCDGCCDEIMPSGDLAEKFRAFGFDTHRINGHSMEEIVETLDKIRDKKDGLPTCVVLDTVKGKGVSYMEDVVVWHGMAPNDEQYRQAISELEGGLRA